MTTSLSDAGLVFADGSVQTTALTSGTQTIAGQKTFAVQPIMPVQSMVRVNTSNGYGSTNTVIRRFTNLQVSQGTDITYADSATAGASFTINTAGVYAISFSDQFSAASSIGLSLNSSQLTTAISGITAADRLAEMDSGGVNYSCTCSWTGYLAAGSIVRPHNQGVAVGSNPSVGKFTIVRIA